MNIQCVPVTTTLDGRVIARTIAAITQADEPANRFGISARTIASTPIFITAQAGGGVSVRVTPSTVKADVGLSHQAQRASMHGSRSNGHIRRTDSSATGHAPIVLGRRHSTPKRGAR